MAIGKTNAQDKSTNYWQVQKIEAAEYHFKKNDSGSWVNTNTIINNKAAVCKVLFRMAQTDSITFTINQDSESSYDYGIIGALDTELTLTNTIDSAILKSFKSVSGEQDFTTNIPKGEHFVYIKYGKDGSVSNGTDTFQFTITSGATEIESGADVRGVTATAADVLQSKFFVNSSGELKQGLMLSYTPSSITILNPDSSSFTLPGNTHIASTLTISAPSFTPSTPVTPTTTEQTINYEYYGFQQPYFLNSVKVAGDEYLKPEYIKSGVSIFGVDGDYAGNETLRATCTGSQQGNLIFNNASLIEAPTNYVAVCTGTNSGQDGVCGVLKINGSYYWGFYQHSGYAIFGNYWWSAPSGAITETFTSGKLTINLDISSLSLYNVIYIQSGNWICWMW